MDTILSYFIENELENLNWDREPRGLYEPIEYALESGGKRLRPALALLAGDMYNANPQDIVPAAVALELFHNFTLLHDDVMDNAATRRQRPTVHKRWGQNSAILSGDQMLIEAYSRLAMIGQRKLQVALQIFNQIATAVCQGQQLDMEFEKRETVSTDEYMQMIGWKTAALLAGALQLGAYIADAPSADQESLFLYGHHLGLAFQIQDDLLDVYGDEETFGKPIGGDIIEGKKTYLLISALEKADKETRERLISVLQQSLPREEKIQSVKKIYDTLHIRDIAEAEIRKQTEKALEQLRQVNAPEDKKQPLVDLAMEMLAREK